MPLPVGTVPVGGPLLDTSGALLTASPALRAAGVISLRAGRLQRVNAAGDGWEDVPGHVIAAAAPSDPFEGMLWYDSSNNALMVYNGSAFAAIGGTGGGATGGVIRHPTATYSSGAVRITLTEAADDAIAVGDAATFQVPPGVSGSDEIVARIGTTGASQPIVDLAGAAVEAQQFTVASRVVLLRRTLNWIVLIPDVNASSDNWRGAWSATARYSDGDIFTHHDAQWLVHGGQDNALIPEPIQYQERRDDIQIIGTHWAALKTSINSDDTSTITSYYSVGQRWIFADERAFICVETGMYLHSDIPGSDGWKEIGAASAAGAVSVDDVTLDGDGTSADPLSVKAIAGAGGPPQASADYEGRIFVDIESLDLLVCTNVPHQTSEATGTFTEVDTVTILPQGNRNDRPPAVLDRLYYAPSEDHFFTGTQLGPGVVGYVQDTAEDVLETARSNNSYAVHWLGPLDSDEEAAALIQTLAADTDYFYYDRIRVQIRRLTRSSFTPAGGTVDHYNWAVPKADDYKDRVDRVEGGALPAIPRDGTGDAWIRVSDDGIYIVDVEHHPATDPTADSWATFADGTDYQGVGAADSDYSTISGTQYYFNTRHNTFRETYIDTSLAVRFRDRTPPDGYIGHFDSRADALNHAAARGIEEDDEFVAYTGALVEEATDFTPSASFETTRNWVFIPVDADDGGTAGGVDSAPVMLFEGPDTPATYVPNVAARPNFRPLVLSRAPAANRTLQVEIVVNTPANTTANPTPNDAVTIYASVDIETNNLVGDDALPVLAGAQLTTFATSQNQGPSVGNTKTSKIARGNENDANDFGHSNIWIGHGLNADGDFVLYVAHSHWGSVAAHIIRVRERSYGGAAMTSEAGAVGERSVARSIISSGHNLAITPRTFNPSTGTPGFAFSAFSFDDVPLSGLDSFSATIRVGGRAGFTINLSKEQIEYAQNQNSTEWAFTDANNYTGGSVIPCVFFEGRHNTGQPFRPSVKPTRSQVGWVAESTEGITGILIFFVYDPASENINHVWTVAFSDVDVEVETMHLHYFEDAE